MHRLPWQLSSKKCYFWHLPDPDEVQSIAKTLNSEKATGTNGIPTKLLKVFDKTITVPLTNVINLSLSLSKSLKLASVIPIFTKDSY